MAAGLRRIATTVGFVLLCLPLTSCAREGRRLYSSEPSVVPSVNAASYEDLSRLAGFTVATPSYLPDGLGSEPDYSYIPDLKEAELAYYAAASVSPPPIVVRLSETLDPDHGHCPPCRQSLSAYDQKTVLGQQVLLARFPSEESRTRILAY